MAGVSNVSGNVNLNASFVETVTAGITGQTIGGGTVQYPLSILSQLGQMVAGQGSASAGVCDLCWGGQFTIASANSVFDFSALADPSGVTRNWTGGRVRLFAIQVLTPTAGFNISLYANSTNGWAFIPLVANALTVMANGGVVMLYDYNSSGSANGMVVNSTSKRFNLDAGANGVVVNAVAIGNSVA